jgi:aryl-alcohol dehydrogenase-like predicted oxidoreductase
VLLLTKVGGDFRNGRKGLSERHMTRAVEDSLRRLQTDRIDLYQSHWPDPAVPLAETLGVYGRLIQAGKVRAIGCSNLDPAQLADALRVARDHGLPAYRTLQTEYNLCARRAFEGGLRALALREGLGVLAHSSLARGFLTGKYRSRADLGQSVRGKDSARYLNPWGDRILRALDGVADRHGAAPAEVALAWVMAREGITAPIASASSRGQLASLVRAAQLVLTGEDLRELEEASDGWWEKAGLGPFRGWMARLRSRLRTVLR